MIAQKHLTGKGEFLYDYKYDILTFKMRNRNYKHSFEFQNFVADVDDRSVEVDTPADLNLAQRYLKGLKGSHGWREN